MSTSSENNVIERNALLRIIDREKIFVEDVENKTSYDLAELIAHADRERLKLAEAVDKELIHQWNEALRSDEEECCPRNDDSDEEN